MNCNGIVVLSLFDGMSCGQLALASAKIKVSKYFASEIEGEDIKNTQKHFPSTIQIGDVNKIYYSKWNSTLYKNCEREVIDKLSNYPYQTSWTSSQIKTFKLQNYEVCDNGLVYKWNTNNATPIYKGKIDLLMGGSPCKSFSSAHFFSYGNKEYGLEGASGLFYEFLRIFKEIKPQYFFFENVKMKKESEKELSNYLGTKALHINSSLMTYQNRERIYITNIEGITIPQDKKVSFQNYKLRTLPRIEKILLEDKWNATHTPLMLTPQETEKIFNMNKWVYKELKAINPLTTKSDVVDEIHKQLFDSTCKVNNTHNKMINGTSLKCKNLTHSDKIQTITTNNDRCPNCGYVEFGGYIRLLTPIELAKGQGVKYSYIYDVPKTRANFMLGNGWTIPIIAHCLKNIKK